MTGIGAEKWRAELETLVAGQEARKAEYRRSVEKRYEEADEKTRQMYRRTLEHIASVQKDEAEAYQKETGVLLESVQADWRRRQNSAEAEDVQNELKAVLKAILGETVDEK